MQKNQVEWCWKRPQLKISIKFITENLEYALKISVWLLKKLEGFIENNSLLYSLGTRGFFIYYQYCFRNLLYPYSATLSLIEILLLKTCIEVFSFYMYMKYMYI